MELTNSNLQEWKAELKAEMLKQHGVDNYDEVEFDQHWIERYIGIDTQDVIDGEVECWEE